MKILLIQPKMNKRPMDTNLKTRMSPSLALLTLKSLTPQEHEVIIVNENIERIDYDIEASLVGITVTLDVFPRSKQIAAEFMKHGKKVVAGGIHITSDPESCMECFNAICIGPAERVWAKIIDDAINNKLQAVYKDFENFMGKEIASPDYRFDGMNKYLYTNVVLSSRGCPNRCAFCYNSCENRLYVQREIPDVMHDIKSLGTRHFVFADDNFISNPDYTRELLQALHTLDFKWGAAVTTKILDDLLLLDAMAAAGCQTLFIGFESINKASLEEVSKDNQVEKYEKLIRAIHERGIMVNASLVFGLDGDTADTFSRTLDWLVKNRIETMTAHILTPYPGTALYKKLLNEGRITNNDLSKYNTANVVFSPRGMTQEQLKDGYLKIYKKFYSLRNIIKRLPVKKAQRRTYLLFNLLYRKYGCISSAVSKIIPMRILGLIAAHIGYKI